MSYAEEYATWVMSNVRRGVMTREQALDYLAPYLNPLDFPFATIKEADMEKLEFTVNDKVRLKDSPYEGAVVETAGRWSSARFRMENGQQITVSDASLLERVLDPQPGDIYEDKHGREWVIRRRGIFAAPGLFLFAQVTDGAPYTPSSLRVSQSEDLKQWERDYEPKLVRRRDA